MTQQGYFIEDLKIGMSESVTKVISDADVRSFAEISGDNNPVHVDDEYAKGTMFKGRIAHGILVTGLISSVLGTKLPGPGAIYMKQELKFTAPVPIGSEVTAVVTVVDIIPEKKRVTLETVCRIGDKDVIKGEAMVMVPSKNK
ncbi:MAG: MaoC family dehydratase [Alphaproteobacteria bacterium]